MIPFEKDILAKEYLSDNTVFADAFNFWLYRGRPVIDPEKLTPLSPELITVLPGKGNDGKEAVRRYRDLLKTAFIMTDRSAAYLILGIENQARIDFSMPVRNMVYDALEYDRQIKERGERREVDATTGDGETGMPDPGEEHESGEIGKPGSEEGEAGHSEGEESRIEDSPPAPHHRGRLKPVITLVLYLGAGHWSGPKSLYEMFPPLDKRIKRFVNNYRISVLEPAALSDASFGRFRTDLGKVLEFIKKSDDKDEMEALIESDKLNDISSKAKRFLKAVTNTDFNLGNGEKEDGTMCKAWEDAKAESWQKGHKEGYASGRNETLRSMTENLQKNMKISAEQAMNLLGIPPEEREACSGKKA